MLIRLTTFLLLLLSTQQVTAYQFNNSFSIDTLLAAATQCPNISDAPGYDNSCETAAPIQLKANYQPGKAHTLHLKLGFSAGDGLREDTPFIIPPWGADVGNAVKDINGRDRNYLLTVWYRYNTKIGGNHPLAISIGIVDATDYLDDNKYANDEYTQFLNASLTNAPNIFLPSYDPGAALEYDLGNWSFRGVVMDVGENKDGENFVFLGFQAGYHTTNRYGESNYRLVLNSAKLKPNNQPDANLDRHYSVLLSMDQTFGNDIGIWLRIGGQAEGQDINYRYIASGGLDVKGNTWGRMRDNIGLGMAYLGDGNLDIETSSVIEAYYRWQIGHFLGLTADVQYQNDELKTGQGPNGFTYSVRIVAEF